MDMFDWLAQRRCPNYFIPDNNMFDHVPASTDVSREMQFVVDFADEAAALGVRSARKKNCLNRMLLAQPLRPRVNRLRTNFNCC